MFSRWFILAHCHFRQQMIYFTFGTKDVLEHECKDLDQRLDLFMDGQRVLLPSLESLVVLNISCWGAGVKPWTLGAGQCSNNPRRMVSISSYWSPMISLFISPYFYLFTNQIFLFIYTSVYLSVLVSWQLSTVCNIYMTIFFIVLWFPVFTALTSQVWWP